MHIPPRVLAGHSHLAVLAMLALLTACANPGDFGRVRSEFVRDDMHDWLSRDAIAGTPSLPSSFELTDDERQLRDLAYPLIEQPYDRHQSYSPAGELGLIGSNHRTAYDRTSYADHLFGTRDRSPAARYAQLIDDIRNDTTRLPQFFENAARVQDIDQKRQKSMAYISGLSVAEKNNALRRVRENAGIISMVRTKLTERVSGYRFALERLVIMTPSSEAVEAERSLNQLQAQIARYRNPTAPGYVREQSLAAAR